MTPSIHFVSQGGPQLASHRMRVLKPITLLNTKVTPVLNASVNSLCDQRADVNIFCKHFDQHNNMLAMRQGKVLGYKTVFDVCDNHFSGNNKDYYIAMCLEADAVTCNTPKMAEAILKETSRVATVIPDPISFPFGTPRHSNEPKIIWYGHSSNAIHLLPWLNQMGNRRVTVVCDTQVNHPNVDWIQWRPNLVESIIKDFDIVLIPTDTKNEAHKCKSPNRAVDALHAGLHVITDNLDIYGPLKEYVWVINGPEDLEATLLYYKANSEGILKMVTDGQAFVKENYNDTKVLEGHLSVLRELGVITKYTQKD